MNSSPAPSLPSKPISSLVDLTSNMHPQSHHLHFSCYLPRPSHHHFLPLAASPRSPCFYYWPFWIQCTHSNQNDFLKLKLNHRIPLPETSQWLPDAFRRAFRFCTMSFRFSYDLASAYSSTFSPTTLSPLGTSSSHNGVFCYHRSSNMPSVFWASALALPITQISARLAPYQCISAEKPALTTSLRSCPSNHILRARVEKSPQTGLAETRYKVAHPPFPLST